MLKMTDYNQKANIKTLLLPASEIAGPGILDNDHLLGVIEFNNAKNLFKNKINSEIPYLNACLMPYLKEPYLELWISKSKVTYISTNDFQFAANGESLFGTASFTQDKYNLEELSKNIYDEIFNNIFKLNYPCLYRIWNYLPHINKTDANGLEHYQSFCHGRAISFKNNCPRGETEKFPASTGIGILSDNVNVYFLASSAPDFIHIENPRQTPAYQYSQFTPPSFARATYNKKAHTLHISGTASIIGSESVYHDNVERQCLTTLENIEILISESNLREYNIDGNFTLKDIDCVKVYIRREADFPIIKDICEKCFSIGASIAYLKADICRPELLVEIEGIIQR